MSSQEYRDRVRDCERLAASATNTEVRRTLLYLAKRWRDFAELSTVLPRGTIGQLGELDLDNEGADLELRSSRS